MPEIFTDINKGEAALLMKNESDSKLTNQQVSEMSRKIKPVEINPFEKVTVHFSDDPASISISEWDFENSAETDSIDQNVFDFSALPGFKTMIIRAKWDNGTACG
ncbi:hypothetical protein D1B31_05020 [Neobacillus notoginsengisoli]|uniref:Uncharacterized protein n=1 Tax=Neobacillus notoginsengisoli TaxID=1578198 RepID=A0A417YWY9_9BACI|nr:hypothetical protein [Neobacillus notoginsengisoli]RHW42008.1 hypothetical protein D1B31_05020 [Neobacillus notoginsengisoli]